MNLTSRSTPLPMVGKTRLRIKSCLALALALAVAMAGLAITATSAQAAPVFIDDFESPNVGPGPFPIFNGQPGTSNTRDTNKWVGANPGFGASENGLLDESGGAFTDPDGEQAYGFRYTNSGVTTVQGVIGNLVKGLYTASFDTVRDGVPGFVGTAATSYRLELVAFDPGADRTEHRGARPGTVLAFAQGNAPTDFSWVTVNLQYTALPGDPNLGKDVGLRFIGAANAAIIDDVSLNVVAVPEPATGTLALLGLVGLAMIRRRRAKQR